mmetsp:Transcript_86208/g.216966  ORF Transcript_86208/g.216966 Transcript_86208/m.216966 type:complete len:222 (-) Transcript_86208:25-690(-)
MPTCWTQTACSTSRRRPRSTSGASPACPCSTLRETSRACCSPGISPSSTRKTPCPWEPSRGSSRGNSCRLAPTSRSVLRCRSSRTSAPIWWSWSRTCLRSRRNSRRSPSITWPGSPGSACSPWLPATASLSRMCLASSRLTIVPARCSAQRSTKTTESLRSGSSRCAERLPSRTCPRKTTRSCRAGASSCLTSVRLQRRRATTTTTGPQAARRASSSARAR